MTFNSLSPEEQERIQRLFTTMAETLRKTGEHCAKALGPLIKHIRDTMPLPGQIYQHRKGGFYTIVFIATEHATLRPVVVYQSQQDRQRLTMPLEEFMDGRFEQVRNFIH